MARGHDPFRVEQRLAHKLRDAEYLLLLVLGLMLWTAGFVDLLTTTKQNGPVLGLYTVRSFIVLLAFAAGFVGWAALIFPRNSIAWLKRSIAAVQRRPAVGLLCTATSAAVFGSLLVWHPWLYYPLLSSAVLLLLALCLGLLLFARPEAGVEVQAWRKWVVGGLAVLGCVEIVLQLGSFSGTLPRSVTNLSGLSVPYGRVYQRLEGAINAATNRYGWPYPAFRLEPGSRRVVITGGTYVQALQVQPRQHVGVRLEERLRQQGDRPATEVLALGMPEYGPGIYAAPSLYPYTTKPLAPAEVVVVFHLANDLQTIDGPGHEVPFFVATPDGQVDVHPADVERRHTLWHAVIPGYEPIHPVTTLKSQLFVLTAIDEWWRALRGRPPLVPPATANLETADDTHPFGRASFAFRRDASDQTTRAFAVATRLLAQYLDALAAEGIQMRLVTLPHFPPGFYAAAAPDQPWSPELGDYDLLRPDRELARFAAERHVPYLPIGSYLTARGMTPAQVRRLFYRDGSGHLTPEGHAFVAEAMYECFYDRSAGACHELRRETVRQ